MRDQFSMQQAMLGGMNNIGQAINENRFAAQQCCCETNRNIDSLRYDAALNTSNINNVATANTQKILDCLCQMESNAKDAQIAQLQMDLQAAQLTLGNAAQTQNIVTALMPPRPVPAYMVNYPCAYNAQA